MQVKNAWSRRDLDVQPISFSWKKISRVSWSRQILRVHSVFVTSDIEWSLRTYKCRTCMRSQEANGIAWTCFLAFHRQCEPKKYLKICSFKFDEIWQKSYSYRAYVNKSLKKKKFLPQAILLKTSRRHLLQFVF